MSAPPSGTFTIRRGLVDDAARLADLAAATFPLACPPHTTAENIELHIAMYLTDQALHEDLQTDGTVFYIVERDGGMIGYAMLIANSYPPTDLPCRNPIEMRRIYFMSEWHGSGVSDVLMRQCIRHARTHGYDVMWLGTNQENARAIGFYARNGFDIVGTKTFTVGGAVEYDHVMARWLDDDTADAPHQPPP